jgi:hypothetical protein
MISLKKYLDSIENGAKVSGGSKGRDILSATIAAYRSALQEMGSCSLNACPALGEELKRGLRRLEENLAHEVTCDYVAETEEKVQAQLEDWGRRTANHHRQKTDEVKEILLVMARTAESVGERDDERTSDPRRCRDVSAQGSFPDQGKRLEAIVHPEAETRLRPFGHSDSRSEKPRLNFAILKHFSLAIPFQESRHLISYF